MDRVAPTWITRSTSPMSMPSSREAVATRARSRPAFSLCSASWRRAFERLPWWVATRSSPRMWARRAAMRSAMRRVLTNTSVVRCARTRSAIRE